MSYNLESYKEPFWAISGNFVRGRDPLGLENGFISLYASSNDKYIIKGI